MNKKQRTAKLRALMKDHNLSAADVGGILNREAQTVRSWSCKYPQRAIPEALLELLELKLQAAA
jgi:hypothetical protein